MNQQRSGEVRSKSGQRAIFFIYKDKIEGYSRARCLSDELEEIAVRIEGEKSDLLVN